VTPPPSELAELDRLFQVSLARFVDERKKLAKELRDAGKRALAKQVAELPKPTPAAWALNQVARRSPERIEAYCAALDAQIEDHRAGAGREALFAAAAAERDARKQVVDAAVHALADDGVKASKPTLDGLGDLLRDAATDPATRPRLAAGSLIGAQPSDGLAALVARVEPTAEKPAPHQQAPAPRDAGAAPEETERRRAAEEAEQRRAAEEAEQRRAAEEAERRRAAEEAERRRAAEEAERRRAAEEAERAALRAQLAEGERAYERAVAAEREAELELEAAKLKHELAQLRRASTEAALRELRERRDPT
jgi:hypothetical protein